MNPQPEPFRAPSRQGTAPARPVTLSHEHPGRLNLRWLRIIAACLIILTVIAVGVILNATRTFVMPIVAGVVLGLIIGPLGDRAKTYGIPPSLVFTGIILALFFGVLLAGALILPTLDTLGSAIPAVREKLGALAGRVEGWFGGTRLFASGTATLDQATLIDWASKALSLLTPALSQALIFLFTLILFLAGRSDIRRSITLAFNGREKRLNLLKTLSNIENRLTDYFITVSVINAGLAVVVWLAFLMTGIPGAERWAALVFLLNFLPVVGPLLVKAGLLAYALVFAPNVLVAFLPLGLFVAISLLEANWVTPRIVGSRMTMNPLMVFISVIFWTWLWGFPGAFLAMPFLAIAGAIHAENNGKAAPRLPG